MGSLFYHTSCSHNCGLVGIISPPWAEQCERALDTEHPNQRFKRGKTRRQNQTPWLMSLSLQLCFFQSVFVVAQPSVKPSSSSVPSSSPSMFLSTFRPSDVPSSGVPTSTPSTKPPSMPPSLVPPITQNPSTHPTNIPSFTFSPSGIVVTRQPTVTPMPSKHPTITPVPTTSPTEHPSAFPSYFTRISSSALFNQRFQVGNSVDFTSQIEIFQEVMEGYTIDLAAEVGIDLESFPTLITAFCIADMAVPADLNSTQSTPARQLRKMLSRFRNLNESVDSGIELTTFVEVQYSMTYRSRNVNVTSLPDRFQRLIANNLANVAQDMQAAGLNVTEALNITRVESVPATSNPSTAPTFVPSSGVPSVAPSEDASLTSSESNAPSPDSSPPSVVIATSSNPSSFPTESSPSPSGGTNSIVITVVASVGVMVVCLLLIIFYRWRKSEPKLEAAAANEASARLEESHIQIDTDPQYNVEAFTSMSSETKDVDGSQKDSIVKNDTNESFAPAPMKLLPPIPSMLPSADSLIGDSDRLGADSDRHYFDLFDKYKDQKLEKMRSGVEETVMEVDEMMSHAVTRALLDDDESQVDRETLFWGSEGDRTEIEATALSEVNDWLKRNKGACVYDRREFMQEILNKMVSSVRHGVLDSDDAARTIHECASMLGLPLAEELDGASIIVNGLRKTATKRDLLAGFSEFGEIENAALSTNGRGFGLVRFESSKAAQRAMMKFTNEEIVVQDVAVMISVLSSQETGPPIFGPGEIA